MPDSDKNTVIEPLVVRRWIDAAPERLFAAWTEPEQMKSWWGPAHVTCTAAEIDLRVGGRYRIANRFADGNVLWIAGAFEQIEPPRLLIYSWWLEPATSGNERVTVRFEPRDGGTDIVVTHERIADQATRDSHLKGWLGCLDGLVGYLRG